MRTIVIAVFIVMLSFTTSLRAQTGTGEPGTASPDTSHVADSLTAADTANVTLDTVALVPETTLTLGDAVAGALRTSPVAAQAAANVNITKSNERVAKGEWLPSVDLTADWYHGGQPALGTSTPGVSASGVGGSSTVGFYGLPTATTSSSGSRSLTSTSPNFDFLRNATAQTNTGTQTPLYLSDVTGPYSDVYGTLSAGWDIFTAGRRPADNAWARDLTRSARSTEVEQRFALIGVVKTTFYNVMRDEDLEQVSHAQLQRAEDDLRFARHRREVGTATTADVLQFELNLNNARQALLQAITNRRSDAYALGRLAGLDGPAESGRDRSVDPTPLALSDTAIIALATSSAPILLAARDSARAATSALYATRTQYFPTLRLGGSYTVIRDATLLGGVHPGWAFDVGTVFPIFDGFVRENGVERASAAQYVARVTQRDAQRNVLAQVEALLGSVHLAEQQIRLARVSVTSARENYRVEQSRYSVGVATVLDLAIAEESLATAEQGLVNSRYDYQLARANLETLIGREL